MIRRYSKKALAGMLTLAVLLGSCIHIGGREAYAAQETKSATSTQYSVERLTTGYTRVSAGYTAKQYTASVPAYDKIILRKADTLQGLCTAEETVVWTKHASGECYCMGMLSIGENEDLLDPRAWKKERYPVLRSNREKGFYGPGHNCFTKDEEGNDICVFHARTYLEIVGDPLYDPNRHAMLMKVVWDEREYPVFDYENMVKFK